MPSIFAFEAHAYAGALVTYGIDRADAILRTADYVDRILRGTKPADLPVQGPETFELLVNLRTAKALGLTISPTLLARADKSDLATSGFGTFRTQAGKQTRSVHRGKADVAVLHAVSGNDCRTHLTARCSESANCGLAPSRTRHSDPIGNLGPGLASNREFALARRIDKLNWCLLGKTDIDEIARIIDLELKRLPH